MYGSSSESGNDSEEPSTSTSVTPKKKQKLTYDQKYKESWEKDIKWVLKSKKGVKLANVTLKFSMAKETLSNIVGHSNIELPPKQLHLDKRQLLNCSVKKTKEVTAEIKAKEADIKLAGFIAEHNLSFKLMDHLPHLLRSICSDSAIAKKIKCGPKKN
nr:unnamed protein product [Callosobruchus analis]